MTLRILLTAATISLFVPLAAWSSVVLPPAGFDDVIFICDTNNTHCTFLTQSSTSGVFYSNTLADGASQISLTASAVAQAGVLNAFTSYTLTAASPFYTQFGAGAAFIDIVTIDGGASLDGSVGFLSPSFLVTGSVSGSAAGSLQGAYEDSVIGTINTLAARNFNSSGTVSLDTISFHFGQPFLFLITLEANTFPSTGVLSSTADFGDTAILSGLAVTDSNHNPVANTTFTSQLGATYTSNGVVPEPSSVLLLGSGLAALFVARCRFSRNQIFKEERGKFYSERLGGSDKALSL